MPSEYPDPLGLQPDFETVDHTADWALRVYGEDLAHLLQNAAQGLASLLVEDLETVPIQAERHLVLDSIDAESLLVEWLGELAYWAESELLVFVQCTLSDVSQTHLNATVVGGTVPRLQNHIKAVTYHELEIVELEGGLTTTIVFDV